MLFSSWSPGGNKIVFVSSRDSKTYSNLELYTMDSDGKKVRRLTNDHADDVYPTWSPFYTKKLEP